MNGRGDDRFAELREGLLALLASIDRVEDEVRLDLSALRLDVETLIGKTERTLRGYPGRTSASATFDYLLRLDGGFSAVLHQWTETLRGAGLAAAHEIVGQVDIHDGWRGHWGDASEHAWKCRTALEERDARAEVRSRPRAGSDVLSLVLVLDLRYATDLPLARIAELFHLSASAVQARVASFEGRVAEEIVHSAIQLQLSDGWRIVSRYDPSDFELRDERAATLPIGVQVVPAWPERENAAGRPRESSAQPLARSEDRARPRIWAVVFFQGPRVFFVPDGRARAAAEGAKLPYARLDTVIQMAPNVGFEVIGDAIRFVVDGLGMVGT